MSTSVRSGMSTLHLSPETLNRAKLQLFHGALAAAHFAGDLSNALLLHKAHVNHPELRLRKPVHQLEQHRVSLNLLRTRTILIERRISRFSSGALPMVGNCPGGDPQQPGDKRHAAPFEFAN